MKMTYNDASTFLSTLCEHGFIVLPRKDKFYLIETENHQTVSIAEDFEDLVSEIEFQVEEKNQRLISWLNKYWIARFKPSKASD